MECEFVPPTGRGVSTKGRFFYLEVNPELDMGEIPSLFYKNFKDEMSNNVLFTDETGNQIDLLLEKGQRTAFIVNGLLNLVILYGLKNGGWLKMLYIGNDVFFTVKVMDENMVEKQICTVPFRICLDVKPSVVVPNPIDLSED
ncbi:hypothetical protein PIB30_094061 [Stylosanthes scabra]|uniref:Uncharacterized protein n=1 Tax=Stylosanthes scabra TaxID=79078 RepID=A0ABU6WTL3_9FABA|nr:hypothetical protein [Stylosanthes scabra]